MQITLRSYQIEIANLAAKLLEQHRLAYLAMEVRCGKTLTALQAAELRGAKRVLFVTKKKAIQSIKDDFHALSPSYGLTVTNYEAIHKYDGDPDLIILDEAHCLGQFPTPAERTRTLLTICTNKDIIYLSGTPTPESYSQLYHQFYVAGNHSPFAAWPSFYKWAKDFVTVQTKYMYNREFKDYSQANKQKIDELTRHLFLTYTQAEAGFTQEIKEQVIKLRMKPATYFLADKLIKSRVHIGKNGEEVIADTEVKLMQKLHQIYSGTVITESGDSIVFDDSKADFIREHFAGKKIAVFYKFKAEAIMLLGKFGSDRLTESPEEFNASTDKVFISQIQSGREGINLATADAIVMLNIDFSSVSYQQARARMQSKDRTKEALLYWIFSENGIEEKIYARVMNKQEFTLVYFKKEFKIGKLESNTINTSLRSI